MARGRRTSAAPSSAPWGHLPWYRVLPRGGWATWLPVGATGGCDRLEALAVDVYQLGERENAEHGLQEGMTCLQSLNCCPTQKCY